MNIKRAKLKGFRLNEKSKDVLFGYALLIPTFAVFAIVILMPILSAIVKSFCDYTFMNANKPLKWNNFANYRLIFKNGLVKQLFKTVEFTLCTVTLEITLGMSIALLLNSNIKGRNALRSVFLMPWTIPSIVTALLWSWLFQAQFGIINFILYALGLIPAPTAEWMSNPSTAMGTVVVAVVWRQTPYVIVMLLAGLQSINQELIEAAAIDGANGRQALFNIKIPAIKQVLGNTIVTSLMSSFQSFTIIYNMTAGGPLERTTTLSIGTYKMAFANMNLGAGSAMGVIWMMILGAGISLYNIKSKRFDNV